MASTRVLQAVGGYADKARMARDADCCMSQFPSLTPEVASHTSNDGSTNKLFKLTGTVPITYMNARYNIPVDIWLPQGYPHKQPKAYVTPTATMAVKPRHRHVGADGICYFPYLHAWSVTSSLQGLIVVMQQAFSEDPPVYAAPTGAMVQPPPQPYAQAAQTAQAAQAAQATQQYQQPQQQPQYQQPQQQQYQQPQQHQARPAAAAAQGGALKQVTEEMEKILVEMNDRMSSELETLVLEQSQLSAGAREIEEGLAALHAEGRELQAHLASLGTRSEELEGWLAKHDTDVELDPEQIVEPKDAVSAQLLDEIAHDMAMEDAIVLLEEAYADENIDTANFLKQVRKIARQQFFHKALVRKLTGLQQDGAGR